MNSQVPIDNPFSPDKNFCCLLVISFRVTIMELSEWEGNGSRKMVLIARIISEKLTGPVHRKILFRFIKRIGKEHKMKVGISGHFLHL